MPLRRSDCRHARTRLLDPRRCDAAPPGGGGEGRAREERAVPVQARTGGARALRRQRTDAMAARAPGRRERTARRADRLLPREGRRRSGEARDSRRRRQSGADLLEHRTGLRSGSGQEHGGVRRGLQEDADGRLLRPSALLARAAVHRLDQGGDAPLQLGSQVRSGLARGSDSRGRRGGDGRGARPHLSELQRAVGAAGTLHRSAHRRRRGQDTADRGQPRSAGTDRAGGARATEHAQHRRCTGRRSPRTTPSTRQRRWPRRSPGVPGPAVECAQGRPGSARADRTPAQHPRASPPRRRSRRRRRSKRRATLCRRRRWPCRRPRSRRRRRRWRQPPRPRRRRGRSWRNGRR